MVIGDSVTSIGSYAFAYCTSLTNVIIPDSVTSISNNAFSNYSSTNIEYNGTVGQWNEIKKDYSWDVNSYSIVIYCADGDLRAGGWTDGPAFEFWG